jgi:hypothetical protein
MAANQYKGKRVAVTFPQATYERLEQVAINKTRSVSATVVFLVEQALATLEENKG